MSTSFPSPLVFSGNDTHAHVAKEIAFLTTALKNCRDGVIKLTPKDPELELFQHISALVTTGLNNDDAIAVSGRVEVDKTVCVVFNNRPKAEDGGGTCTKLTPNINRGEKLLKKWRKLEYEVLFDEHLQDIVDILGYLPTANDADTRRMLLFMHCRALPELSARVENVIKLWGDAPFRLIASHYERTGFPIQVASASFLLNIPQKTQEELARHGLERDQTYVSTNGSTRYHVSSDNLAKWASFVDLIYGKIEGLVFANGSRKSDPLTPEQALHLLSAMGMFSMLIKEKTLMKAMFASDSLESYLRHQYNLTAYEKEANAPRMAKQDSSSVPYEDEVDFLLDDEPSNSAGRGAHLLRCCRTITAWYEAVSIIAKNTKRYPKAFDVHHVNGLPTKHEISRSDVLSFKDRYLAHFGVMDCTSALRFIEDRLGPNQIDKIIETATTAIAHEEATAMGLVCISILGGETFGNVPREEVQALFPHPPSGRIPISARKKCCRSCIILAEVLKEHMEVEFVLPGTHATFLPWSPPQGLSLDILKEIREKLCTCFIGLAYAYHPYPQASPASSAVGDVMFFDSEDSDSDNNDDDGGGDVQVTSSTKQEL